MIIEGFVYVVTSLIQFMFGWLNIPDAPESIKYTFDTYFGYIFDNLDFLNFFININTFKVIATIAITIYTFKVFYKIIMWIIHKIPLLSIKQSLVNILLRVAYFS